MKTCAVEEWSRQLGAFVSRADANVTCSYMPYAFHSTNTARNIWGGVLGREARCFCLVIPTALSSEPIACNFVCAIRPVCTLREPLIVAWVLRSEGLVAHKRWLFAQARSLFSVH